MSWQRSVHRRSRKRSPNPDDPNRLGVSELFGAPEWDASRILLAIQTDTRLALYLLGFTPDQIQQQLNHQPAHLPAE